MIQAGFASLMSSLPSTLPSLALFFQFTLRVKGQEHVKIALHDYVIQCCYQIFQSAEDAEPGPDDVISRIVSFKDNIDTAVHQAVCNSIHTQN
jgi:hypothetical protein